MFPMTRTAWTLLALALPFPLPAQDFAIPSQLQGLPGNRGISMPGRWSQGVMQVIWDRELIPDELKGQTIRRIRLRRPSFPDEPDYPALQRTFKVSMGMTQTFARGMTSILEDNRPASLTVVAGPTTVSLPAVSAQGAGDPVAGALIDLVLDQPFVVDGTGNLFLEWENLDSSLSISQHHWIDAIQIPQEGGIALQVGNGGCGSVLAQAPMTLSPVPGPPPASGTVIRLQLRRALPGVPALVVLGLDPQNKQPPWNLGFGGHLGALSLPGCYQWTGLELAFPQLINPLGAMAIKLAFPPDVELSGQRIGVQVAVADPQANSLGFAFSNGVLLFMDTVGASPDCASVLAPGTESPSPFPPFRGLAPLILFGL